MIRFLQKGILNMLMIIIVTSVVLVVFVSLGFLYLAKKNGRIDDIRQLRERIRDENGYEDAALAVEKICKWSHFFRFQLDRRSLLKEAIASLERRVAYLLAEHEKAVHDWKQWGTQDDTIESADGSFLEKIESLKSQKRRLKAFLLSDPTGPIRFGLESATDS
jgi:nitrogen fixation-related uncharacterized protein